MPGAQPGTSENAFFMPSWISSGVGSAIGAAIEWKAFHGFRLSAVGAARYTKER